MSRILVGPTGMVVRGNVHDVRKESLEQKLKRYDSRLYLTWNPRKNARMGVWELRRRDECKSIVDWAEFEGNCYTRLEYAENNFVNHILDVPVLGYHLLDKLKQMDTWDKGYNPKNVAEQAERNLDSYNAAQTLKNQERLKYHLRQYKGGWKRYQEMILSGMDPSELARHWGKNPTKT